MRWQVIAALIGAGLAAVLSIWFLFPALSQQEPEGVNLLANPGFEMGFAEDPNCGLVGLGWRCFRSEAPHTQVVVQPETWPAAIRTGRYAQLLGMITPDPGAPPDRVMGVFQRVHVVPGAKYTVVIRGLIRADDHDADPWRYVVEWGYDPEGRSDWRQVREWEILPWNRYDPREAPGKYLEYTTTFVAPSDRITLFVRLRNKWGTWPREVILNLDDLALVGPDPAAQPTATPVKATPTKQAGATVKATTADACAGQNLLLNGSFEDGVAANGVAEGWQAFVEGGPASFGFWDAGLIARTKGDNHGQVIAVDMTGLPPAGGAVGAGIIQKVKVTPGARYRLCAWGYVQAHPATAFTAPPAAWGLGSSSIVWYAIPWTPPADGRAKPQRFTAEFTAVAPTVVIGLRVQVPAGTRVEDVAFVLRDVRLVAASR